MRSEQEVNEAVDLYADMIKRICMVYLKNVADTEDIFQTVFLKYMTSSICFESRAHEKAWMIKVTINACKDLLKSFFRSRIVSIEEIIEAAEVDNTESTEVLHAVLELPKKYREAVYLHYYEGYSAVEIGTMLNRKVNTVYSDLARAREILKAKLGDDELG